MNKIKTKFTKELWTLVKVLAKNKGLLANFPERSTDDCIVYEQQYGFWADRDFVTQSFKEISPLEFLSFLYNISGKTVFSFEKLPWPVEISGELVRIGCQKNIPLSEFKRIIQEVEKDKSAIYKNFELVPHRKTLAIFEDGILSVEIAYEIWDEFKGKVKEFLG